MTKVQSIFLERYAAEALVQADEAAQTRLFHQATSSLGLVGMSSCKLRRFLPFTIVFPQRFPATAGQLHFSAGTRPGRIFFFFL